VDGVSGDDVCAGRDNGVDLWVSLCDVKGRSIPLIGSNKRIPYRLGMKTVNKKSLAYKIYQLLESDEPTNTCQFYGGILSNALVLLAIGFVLSAGGMLIFLSCGQRIYQVVMGGELIQGLVAHSTFKQVLQVLKDQPLHFLAASGIGLIFWASFFGALFGIGWGLLHVSQLGWNKVSPQLNKLKSKLCKPIQVIK
jgi:hypothetical protein